MVSADVPRRTTGGFALVTLKRIFVTSLCQEYDIDAIGRTIIRGNAESAHVDPGASHSLLYQEGPDREGARQGQAARRAGAVRRTRREGFELYAALRLGDRLNEGPQSGFTFLRQAATAAAKDDAQRLILVDGRARARQGGGLPLLGRRGANRGWRWFT